MRTQGIILHKNRDDRDVILNCFFLKKKLLKNFLDIFQNQNNSSNTQNKDAVIFTISFLFLIICFFFIKGLYIL